LNCSTRNRRIGQPVASPDVKPRFVIGGERMVWAMANEEPSFH